MNNRKRTIYAGILILGALALLTDRLLYGPSVQPAAAAGRSLSALGVETSVAPTVSVAAAPFPDALPAQGPLEHLRDIFTPTERAQIALLGISADRDPRTGRLRRGGAPDVVTAEKFQQNHRLTAVLVGKESSFAIVDDNWLRVGDTLDTCELTEITGTGASFKCANGLASLSAVETPTTGGGRS